VGVRNSPQQPNPVDSQEQCAHILSPPPCQKTRTATLLGGVHPQLIETLLQLFAIDLLSIKATMNWSLFFSINFLVVGGGAAAVALPSAVPPPSQTSRCTDDDGCSSGFKCVQIPLGTDDAPKYCVSTRSPAAPYPDPSYPSDCMVFGFKQDFDSRTTRVLPASIFTFQPSGHTTWLPSLRYRCRWGVCP
jgi:hypothetical protein